MKKLLFALLVLILGLGVFKMFITNNQAVDISQISFKITAFDFRKAFAAFPEGNKYLTPEYTSILVGWEYLETEGEYWWNALHSELEEQYAYQQSGDVPVDWPWQVNEVPSIEWLQENTSKWIGHDCCVVRIDPSIEGGILKPIVGEEEYLELVERNINDEDFIPIMVETPEGQRIYGGVTVRRNNNLFYPGDYYLENLQDFQENTDGYIYIFPDGQYVTFSIPSEISQLTDEELKTSETGSVSATLRPN